MSCKSLKVSILGDSRNVGISVKQLINVIFQNRQSDGYTEWSIEFCTEVSGAAGFISFKPPQTLQHYRAKPLASLSGSDALTEEVLCVFVWVYSALYVWNITVEGGRAMHSYWPSNPEKILSDKREVFVHVCEGEIKPVSMTLHASRSRSRTHKRTLQMSGQFHTPLGTLLLHLLSPHVSPSPIMSHLFVLFSSLLSRLFAPPSLLSHLFTPAAAPHVAPSITPTFFHPFLSCSVSQHLTQSCRISTVNKTNLIPSENGQHGCCWNCICVIMSYACVHAGVHFKIMEQHKKAFHAPWDIRHKARNVVYVYINGALPACYQKQSWQQTS